MKPEFISYKGLWINTRYIIKVVVDEQRQTIFIGYEGGGIHISIGPDTLELRKQIQNMLSSQP